MKYIGKGFGKVGNMTDLERENNRDFQQHHCGLYIDSL